MKRELRALLTRIITGATDENDHYTGGRLGLIAFGGPGYLRAVYRSERTRGVGRVDSAREAVRSLRAIARMIR